MTEQVISGGTLAAAFIALWITRKAWAIPSERGAVINVALQTLKVIAVLPAGNHWFSSKLHTFTGVWNLEELGAHICYMVGMFALLYLVASRLDMTRSEFRSFCRYRIEVPLTLAVPIMVALFVYGPGRSYVVETVSSDTNRWLHAYWLVDVWLMMFILIQMVNGLRVIRRNPRSRKAANSYLCAAAVSFACCAAFTFEQEWLQWILIRVEVVAYAFAAAYTWRSKCSQDETAGQLQPN